MDTQDGRDRQLMQQQAEEGVRRGKRHHQQAIEAKKRGLKDLAIDDFGRAIESLSEVIRLDASHVPAYLLRARVFEEMGEDDKAEADLAEVRRLESN